MHWNNLRVSRLGLSVTADQVEINEPDVDLYAWITNGGGSNGIAYTGGACSVRWKTSLTRGPSRYNAIIETAEVSMLYKQTTLLSYISINFKYNFNNIGTIFLPISSATFITDIGARSWPQLRHAS